MMDKHALIAVITTHLNAPYGPIVREEHVEGVLRAGALELHCDPKNEAAKAILARLFVECEPRDIGVACMALGLPLENAHSLYLDLVSSGQPRSWKWEGVMKGVVY